RVIERDPCRSTPAEGPFVGTITSNIPVSVPALELDAARSGHAPSMYRGGGTAPSLNGVILEPAPVASSVFESVFASMLFRPSLLASIGEAVGADSAGAPPASRLAGPTGVPSAAYPYSA